MRRINKIFVIFGVFGALAAPKAGLGADFTLRKDEIAFLGASGADAASSWRRFEANPLLRDASERFGARGVALKVAIAGGTLLLERKVIKSRRVNRVLNYGLAAFYGSVATRNLRTR